MSDGGLRQLKIDIVTPFVQGKIDGNTHKPRIGLGVTKLAVYPIKARSKRARYLAVLVCVLAERSP
jgi:hypothetical protein